jgi:hypothetical protein
MSKSTATIVAQAFSDSVAKTYLTAPNEQMRFDSCTDESNNLILVDSFTTNLDGTHMTIDYLRGNEIVLSQRTAISTIKEISEYIYV